MSEGHLLWSIRIWVLSRLGKRRDLTVGPPSYTLFTCLWHAMLFKCLLASIGEGAGGFAPLCWEPEFGVCRQMFLRRASIGKDVYYMK